MSTSFRGVHVADTASGRRSLHPVTSASIYLDTSDLSYLLLGRIGKDTERPSRWRTRLEQLLAADRVRLRVSPVHLAELALRPDLLSRGLDALSSTPNLYLVMSRAADVFRAELEGHEPIVLVERPATELRGLTIPMRWFPAGIPGPLIARVIKMAVRWGASASGTGKRAQVDHPVERERVLRMLRGETTGIPPWLHPATLAFARLAPWIARRAGLPANAVERLIQEEGRGFGWATATTTAELPRRQGRNWREGDVRALPATLLRASVEQVHANPRRPADQGTRYDIAHLAYVAYSDFSTVDGANLDAVKQVLRQLPHLHVFRTGSLDPLLDAVEERDGAAPMRQR